MFIHCKHCGHNIVFIRNNFFHLNFGGCPSTVCSRSKNRHKPVFCGCKNPEIRDSDFFVWRRKLEDNLFKSFRLYVKEYGHKRFKIAVRKTIGRLNRMNIKSDYEEMVVK